MLIRILCAFVLVLSAIFLPWYFSVALFAVFCAFFRNFFEGILAVIFLDTMYFSPRIFAETHIGFFTASFIFIFFASGILKRFITGRNILSNLIVASANSLGFVLIALLFFK